MPQLNRRGLVDDQSRSASSFCRIRPAPLSRRGLVGWPGAACRRCSCQLLLANAVAIATAIAVAIAVAIAIANAVATAVAIAIAIAVAIAVCLPFFVCIPAAIVAQGGK